jgi:penicillin-binding protein 1C
MRARYVSSDARLLDRNGQLLQERRLAWNGRSLGWVPIADISPALRIAVVDAEDRRFFEHDGVDWRALLGAAWQNLTHGSKRGASTITMQVASVLEAQQHHGRRSVWDKFHQVKGALELEKSWSKDEILEAYLNLVSYRGEERGVAAAAGALFGKDPHGLDLQESYLLATLLRSPEMTAESAGSRLCREAAQVKGLGSCDHLKSFASEVLARAKLAAPTANFSPHLARKLLSAGDGDLRTTISLPLQLATMDALKDQLASLKAQNVRDAAVIVVENRTGEVIAYVGGSELSASPEVDMAESRRQAGSTLKPFLYALAFDKGYLTPDSWVLDEPFEVGLDRGSYEPDNYDHLFHGPVPAKVALASSLNIPAVRVAGLVGVDDFQNLLQELGFRKLEDGDHYGASLALGTADVTLFDLTQSYMALANLGIWHPLRFFSNGRLRSKRILSKKAAEQVAAILSDRGFRSLTFGWDSLLATPYPSAVKTGTSKDMRDNWCVGFSKEYTVGVWVGNASGEPMWAVSGTSGAAPVWRAVMDRLHSGRKAQPLPALAFRDAPTLERGHFGQITYPTNGAILAIDPDIPPAHQRVLVEAEGTGRFFLDGEPLIDPMWMPVKGKHRLRYTDAFDVTLDELSFEVR